MKNQRGITTTVIIIIMAAIVAVAGAWLLWANMDKTSNSNTTANKNVTAENTNIMVNNANTNTATPDLQTYTNSEFNFKVQYPADWVVVDTRDEWGNIVGFRDSAIKSDDSYFSEIFGDTFSQIYIQYFENPESLTICDFYKKSFEESEMAIPDYCADLEMKELTVNGINALQFPSVPGAVSNIITSLIYNGKVFEISMVLDNNKEPRVYNQIIESFEFLVEGENP